MTIRQQRRIALIGKNRTTKAELLEAGYSPSTANDQPKTVMKAKGWLKLLEERLPDETLLSVTQQALSASQIDPVGHSLPNHSIRLKAAEQGYKLKNRFGQNSFGAEFSDREKSVKIYVTRGEDQGNGD